MSPRERPILMNGPMVRATLEGRKTQTRRIADTGLYAIDETIHGAEIAERERVNLLTRCPQGQPGDQLWVRETFATLAPGSYEEEAPRKFPGQWVRYAANRDDAALARCNDQRWHPSIHMPRWASRITLEVTGVRIERLQDISEEDAKAEGLAAVAKDGNLFKWGIPDRDGLPGGCDDGWPWAQWDADPRAAFRRLWDSIYQDGKSWDANPWVWVAEFEVVR